MNILDRYLMARIAGGMLIATLVLLPLFGFLDLLEELEDVGQGYYRTADAFLVVALMAPRRFVELIPFIALIGNVAALGRLAANHEITAMRAAGLSPWRIGLASLKVGFGLLVLIGVLEQFVAPHFQQQALAHRAEAMEQTAELGEDLGIWTRSETRVLRIGNTQRGDRTEDVEVMEMNKDGTLLRYMHAGQADVSRSDLWRLSGVTVKEFAADQVESRRAASVEWKPFITSDDISRLTRPPASLPPLELHDYIRYLRDTGQRFETYALALWRKPGAGLVTIAMLLLSVPFAFGSVRSGLASRLILAAVTGIGVYLLDQIISNAGLLIGLSAPVVALTPGLLLIGVAHVALRRTA